MQSCLKMFLRETFPVLIIASARGSSSLLEDKTYAETKKTEMEEALVCFRLSISEELSEQCEVFR